MNSSLIPATRWNWMQSLASILSLLICVCFPAASSAQSLALGQEPAARDQAEQIGVQVHDAFQDRDGNYWFSAGGVGVCRYDGKSLTYFSREELGWGVSEILQDEGGAMWFATYTGVSRYEDGKFTNYTMANGLSHNRVWSMMLDSTGTLWAGTSGGVCRFDGESFVPFPIPRAKVENPYSNLSPLLAWGMAEDQDGNLWFAMDGEGVRKFDGESFTTYTTKDGLAGNNVLSVHADRRGRMWFGTKRGGVSCYDGTAFRNFTEEDGLTSNHIWAILEDSAGNMWFSTLGAGACRYDGKFFTAFREDHGLMINGRPAHSHVNDMFEDRDGILWFACAGGLFYLDGESFINVTKNGPWPAQSTTDDQEPDDSPPPAPTTTRDQAEQLSAYVRVVFQDRDGNHWFGTIFDGVFRYDGKSLTHFTMQDGFGATSTREILQDEGGAMWFATHSGVTRYENGKFTNYTMADGLSHESVWSMMLDSADTLWVGTVGGVCRFNGKSFVPFSIPRAEVENPYSNISPLLAWGMAEDQDGNLWFGMDGEGGAVLGLAGRCRLGWLHSPAEADVVYWLRPRSRLLPGGRPRRTSGNLTTTVSVAAPTGPPTLIGSTRTSIFAWCFSRSITIWSTHRRTAACRWSSGPSRSDDSRHATNRAVSAARS